MDQQINNYISKSSEQNRYMHICIYVHTRTIIVRVGLMQMSITWGLGLVHATQESLAWPMHTLLH